MWKAAAVMALFAASPAIGQVILADARSSAKFVKPAKVRVANFSRGCGPREQVSDNLTQKYGEEIVWQEASKNRYILQLWQGDESWTVTKLLANETMCVLDDGKRRQAF